MKNGIYGCHLFDATRIKEEIKEKIVDVTITMLFVCSL